MTVRRRARDLLAAVAVLATGCGAIGPDGLPGPASFGNAGDATALSRAPTTTESPAACTGPAGRWRHDRLGISPGYSLISRDAASVERELDGIAASGVCWIRIDIDWSRVEHEPGRFDWTATDRAVNGARARGLEVLALVAYTPAWARPQGTTDKHPPFDPAAFAQFAEVAARRYAPAGVRTWEIWNEPNIQVFWEPGADPDGYAQLLTAAADAIRGVDADATILAAGLSPASDQPDGSNMAPVTFLDHLYRIGAADSFDAVAMHPYSYPLHPLEAVPLNHFISVTPALRDVMIAHGDASTQIWATEYGAPTGASAQAVSPEDQAAFLADALAQWERWSWTGPLMIYSWRDGGTDAGDREQNFGLLDHDFRAKPALQVLFDVTGVNRAAADDPDG